MPPPYDQTAVDLTGYEQCAGAYFEVGQCMGVYGSTFTDNQGAGPCVNYAGTCEPTDSGGITESVAYQNIEYSFVYQQLFNRSTVTDPGGAASLTKFLGMSRVSVDVRDSLFSNNNADGIQWSREIQDASTGTWWLGGITGGAGMYFAQTTGGILANVTVANNTATAGAGIYLNSCSGIVMWDCLFDGNAADAEGGAIYLADNLGGGVMLGNSTLHNNYAGESGGAFACESPSSLIITNGTTGNTAEGGSGALFCDSCKEVTIQLGSRLEGNAAGLSGGAGCLDDCQLLQIGDSQVLSNRGRDLPRIAMVLCIAISAQSQSLVVYTISPIIDNKCQAEYLHVVPADCSVLVLVVIAICITDIALTSF